MVKVERVNWAMLVLDDCAPLDVRRPSRDGLAEQLKALETQWATAAGGWRLVMDGCWTRIWRSFVPTRTSRPTSHCDASSARCAGIG